MELNSLIQQALGGSMLLAIPMAALVGVVSFFSPCVVPLLPGYLSFATGLGAAEVLGGKAAKGRMLLGTSLFVLGFAAVFVTTGVLVGTLGSLFYTYQSIITPGLGVVAVLLGLVFLGVIPLGGRQLRLSRVPKAGIVAAPLLGVVFGFGWTPCVGPALGVVLSLAMNEASALRGGILSFVFALGMGIPFVVAGLAFTKMARLVSVLQRHQVFVMRLGGITMVITGLLLITGLWEYAMAGIRQWAASFGAII